MKNFIFLILAMLMTITSFAQNDYFDTDQSGFSLTGQISSYESSTLLGIGGGYTSEGKITIGINLGIEESREYNLTSTLARPYLSFRVVRQGENNSPLNISMGIAYQHNTFKSLELTAGTINFSLGASHRISSTSKLVVIPVAGIGYNRTIINTDLQWFSNRQSGVGFTVGTSLLFNKFHITPTLSFADGNSNFNL